MEDSNVPDDKEVKKEDPIKNLKSEFNRKIDNLTAQNQQLTDQLSQLISYQVEQTKNTKVAEDSEDNLSELVYSDPVKYQRIIEERATKRAEERVNQVLNQQTQTNQMMTQLTQDYPEISDMSSDLYKKAVEIYGKLPASDRQSPLAYRTAIREAAAEVGVLPVAKRRKIDDDNDSFSMGAGGGGSSSKARNANKSKELDSTTLGFAQAMGLNIKDPKVIERLKKNSQRSNWSKYSGGSDE